MTQQDGDITLKMIMDHLQHMQIEMNRRFIDLETRLEARLGERIDGLGNRVGSLENRVDRMDRNLTRQIDAIDQRLDAVEIEMLPKRVTKLEEKVFAA